MLAVLLLTLFIGKTITPSAHQYLACALTLGHEVGIDDTRELHHNQLLLYTKDIYMYLGACKTQKVEVTC